jgi:hypothetical protein
LERQIRAALFERVVLAPPKVAPVAREIHPEALFVFRDSYATRSGQAEAHVLFWDDQPGAPLGLLMEKLGKMLSQENCLRHVIASIALVPINPNVLKRNRPSVSSPSERRNRTFEINLVFHEKSLQATLRP